MGSMLSFSSSDGATSIPKQDVVSTERTERQGKGKRSRQQPNDVDDDLTQTNDRSSVSDEVNPEESYPQPKRRRTATPFSLATDAFHSISEKMSFALANGFFLGVEFAARNGELADEVEVIQSLVQMLDYFQSKDVLILRRGWRALYACSHGLQEQPQEMAADTGCGNDISTVVAVMDRHPTSIKLQLLGCRALKTLTNQKDDWFQLWEAGAISVFLKALENHPQDIVMQGLAVTFLAMLVREKGEPPRAQVLCEGGVALILRAMRRFEHDPRLLHTGCYALHQLGFGLSSRALMLHHGGIPILLRSVEAHLDDEALVDLCLSALSKLSDEDSMQGHTVVHLVLRSMECYPNEPSIQGHCLVLLLRSIGTESSRQNIEASVRAILTAMKNFQDSSSVQFFACAALREILQQTHSRRALEVFSNIGGLEYVVTAASNHRRVFGVQPMALLLLIIVLEQLSADRQASTAAFGGSDRVAAIVAGLQIL